MKTKQQLIKKVAKLQARIKKVAKLQARIKKVAKLQARIDAMPDAPVKTGVIYEEPEHGTEVWALDDTGEVSSILNYSVAWHRELIQGLLFHDEESAINAVKVRAVRHKLAGFCAKAWENEGEVIDWNSLQRKYNLFYEYEENRVLLGISYRITKGIYHLPCNYLTELKAAFTQDELKLALTGEV